MKYTISLLFLLITLNNFAQPCDKALLRQKTGTWKAGQQGSIQNVSAANLAKEKSALASIQKMVTTNYHPTGCQVTYATVYGKNLVAGKNWIADPYYYSMYILRYLCDKNSADKSKYYVDISTPTTVNITANVIFSLNNLYAAELPADDFRGYLKLDKMPQKKDGAWFLGEEVVGDYGTPGEIKEYRWLITYNDTLPFIYLTRKEYLLIQQKRLTQTISEEGASEFYTTCMNNITAELKKPVSELNKTAICPWNDEQRFTRFVEEGTKGSFIAIKPNPAYYRKKLPLSSPQFFSVVYKIAGGDPVFEENISGIKKAVDFEVLRNMLGR
jgi:hypothetical protein